VECAVSDDFGTSKNPLELLSVLLRNREDEVTIVYTWPLGKL
jgi:hypothetical protein